MTNIFTVLSFIFLFGTFESQAQGNYAISKSLEEVPTNESTLKESMLADVVSANNIASYNIEYELVDYVFPSGDSSLLDLLSIQDLYASRLINDDREFYDLANGVKIQLYSYKKALARRNGSTDADYLKD
ncbi:MAG: hypothetical protein ACI865_002835 [Flavobacteriaceae bacterium]|jgi:hypothetical protein